MNNMKQYRKVGDIWWILNVLFLVSGLSLQSSANSIIRYTSGHTVTLNACTNTPSVSLDGLLTVSDSSSTGGYATGTLTWSLLAAPGHGLITGLPFGTSASGTDADSASGILYLPDSGFSGSDSMRISVMDSGGAADTITIICTLAASPSAITGGSHHVCFGTSFTLSDSVPGGDWSANPTSVANVTAAGVVNTFAAGSAVITYTTGCLPNAFYTIISDSTARATSITVTHSPCVGGDTTTFTDSTLTGIWHSSNNSVCIIDSATGVATGISTGAVTISFTFTNACGSASATKIVTVGVPLVISPITGASSACAGGVIMLTDTTTGGSWSCAAGGATVSSGTVAASSAGTYIISYSKSNMCGTATATYPVTFQSLHMPPGITGPASFCPGSSLVVADSGLGGSWHSSDTAIVQVNDSGTVRALTPGEAIISYSIINSCGTIAATLPVTVYAIPHVSAITGVDSLCQGDSLYLSDSVSGGIWTTSDASVMSVNNITGLLTGLRGDTVTIYYTQSDYCGSVSASFAMTVHPLPDTGFLSGSSSLCMGSTTTLIPAVSGGSWLMADTSVAIISDSGVVTALTEGTSPVTYTVSNRCGSISSFFNISVDNTPDSEVIEGSLACLGDTATFRNVSEHGLWSSNNPFVISIDDTTGFAHAEGTGTAIITYVEDNSCGISRSTKMLTVYPIPGTGTIFGSGFACIGATATLGDTTESTPGLWNSSDTAIATISPLGVVSATDTGSIIISYSFTNVCGTSVSTFSLEVQTVPYISPILGPDSVCPMAMATYSDSNTSGSWSVSDRSIAAINASGGLTGYSAGIVTISYTVNNNCYASLATKVITINPNPAPGRISGTTTLCIDDSVEVLRGGTSTGPGIWSISDSSIAIVGTTGAITPLASGTATVTYAVTTLCGTASTTTSLRIVPLLTPATLLGDSVFCADSALTLTATVGGGVWSSSDDTIATVTAGGIVSGLSAGVAQISYTQTNICNSFVAVKSMTVAAQPFAGTISGYDSVCTAGGTIVFATDTGGYWTATNGSAIVIDGSVTGEYVGVDTILYIVTNSCRSDSAKFTMYVIPSVNAGTIICPAAACLGSVVTLSDSISNGSWSATNSADSLNANIVSCLIPGYDTIYYSLSNSCSAASATFVLEIDTMPVNFPIIGDTIGCPGDSISFSDAALAGIWSCDTTLGTIDQNGKFTAHRSGLDTIAYSVINACADSVSRIIVNIHPLPHAAMLTIPSQLCKGISYPSVDSVPGGNWYIADTNVITFTSPGVLTPKTSGQDSIVYWVANVCGSDTVHENVQVLQKPSAGAITGPDSICAHDTAIYADTAIGGTWFVASPAATFDSGHLLNNAYGYDTIYYRTTDICGSDTTRFIVFADTLPTPAIQGMDFVCLGALEHYTTLSAQPSGGKWISMNTDATVTSSGLVTAVSPGVDTIAYSFTNTCGTATATIPMTVYTAETCPLAVPGIANQDESLKLYPNPAKSLVEISIPQHHAEAVLLIYDELGRVIEKIEIPGNTNQYNLNISHWPRGTYIATLADDAEIYRSKLVVE